VAGVILRERIPAFERMLWRACRGNVFLKQAEIDSPLEDPVTVVRLEQALLFLFLALISQLHNRATKCRFINVGDFVSKRKSKTEWR